MTQWMAGQVVLGKYTIERELGRGQVGGARQLSDQLERDARMQR